MGCTSPSGCHSGCKSPLRPKNEPPPGGWKLYGWPDFVPAEFIAKWEYTNGRALWHGNSVTETLGLITRVLNSNPEVPPYSRIELCDWAREQWCAAAPDRCLSSGANLKLAKQRRSHNVLEAMAWAPEFWRSWNLAVSDQEKSEAEAQGIMHNFCAIAVSMLSGSYGCADCLDHFLGFVGEHPIERIHSFRQARVWLWRVHNESKKDISGFQPIKYGVIADIYEWDHLTDSEVLEVIAQLQV